MHTQAFHELHFKYFTPSPSRAQFSFLCTKFSLRSPPLVVWKILHSPSSSLKAFFLRLALLLLSLSLSLFPDRSISICSLHFFLIRTSVYVQKKNKQTSKQTKPPYIHLSLNLKKKIKSKFPRVIFMYFSFPFFFFPLAKLPLFHYLCFLNLK